MSEYLFSNADIYFVIMENTTNTRLREVRKYLHLNQKEMAEMLTVKQSYYSEVENGKRPVTGKLVEILSTKKSVSADWMYTGKGEIFTGEHSSTSDANEDNETLQIASKIEDKDVYDILLKNVSKRKDKTLYYNLKAAREIKNERPDLWAAMKVIGEFHLYVSTMNEIYEKYLKSKAINKPTINTDYETHKNEIINSWESFIQYQETIKPFLASAKRFLKSFKKFDIDKSILYYKDED